MNEYFIESNTNKEANFSEVMKKSLGVNLIQDDDEKYSFIMGEYKVITTTTLIVEIQKLDMNVDKIYTSVAKMKADTKLTSGKIVYTEGYYSAEYGGNAYYKIVDSTNLIVDDAMCIKLKNGLYAELDIMNDTITVNQFGAYGDGKHDDYEAINKAVNSGISNIQFESEEYKISKALELKKSNMSILGNNATIFFDDDFVFMDDFIIRVYNSEEVVKNLQIQNLSVVDRNTIRTNEILMFKVIKAENIELFRCNLEAYNVEGKKERRVTNIDLRNHWKNIIISNCNLINTTEGPAGGTIWIRAGDEGTGNLTMRDNYIKKSCHDETIALFGEGYVEDVTIEKNRIDFDDTNVAVKSYPVIAFGADTYCTKNVKFIDNDVNIIANAGFITISNTIDILIDGNNFDITSCYDTTASFFGAQNSSNVVFSNNEMILRHEKRNVSDEVFNGFDKLNNNIITIDSDFIFFTANCSEFCNNIINVKGELNNSTISLVMIRNKSLIQNIDIKNNEINIDSITQNAFRFLNLYQSYLNDCKIEMSDNIIVENEKDKNEKKYLVYFQNMLDSTAKSIYVKNNTLGKFTKIGDYQNSTTYSIITK